MSHFVGFSITINKLYLIKNSFIKDLRQMEVDISELLEQEYPILRVPL
jgi:hypothetical protein